MERRAFVARGLLGLLAAPVAAGAQPAGKVPRIGVLAVGVPSRSHDVFRQGLRDLGYVEGRSILIEWRYAEGKVERLPDLAAELVRLEVDVIVAGATAGTEAARHATTTIPIVAVATGDPVQLRFAKSLARPGGNITGMSFWAGTEIVGQHLQLLRDAVPGVSRVAVLGNPGNPALGGALQEVKAAARVLGLTLQLLEARGPGEFDRAFSAMAQARAQALLVMADAAFVQQRVRLVELAAGHRLPAMYGQREYADAGGLMAHGPSVEEMFRRAATFVDKILKGARPADLPYEQPTKFEFVVNLRTARALGLTLPPAILARADQVIE